MALKTWNTNFRSIQPKSKMSGLNFRQLLVANGTAFSKICNKRGHFHWTKTFKIWKQRQMTQKFPGKVSRNSESCWISEMRTFLPKILEIPGAKLNRTKTSGKKVSSWVYLARVSSFWKFRKMLFHSLLEVAENLNRTFWLNEKRPRTTSRGIPKCDLTIWEKRR